MAMATKPPAIRIASMVWKYRGKVDGLSAAAKKSVSCALGPWAPPRSCSLQGSASRSWR